MNSKDKVIILLNCMKEIATCMEVSEKETSRCKELYVEVRILCLGEVPVTGKEKLLYKSKIKMLEKDAIFALQIRIKNLIESIL